MDRTDKEEYGVFKGDPHFKPFRLGIVGGKHRAIELMERMCEKLPGKYFVMHMVRQEVVASTLGIPENQPKDGVSGKEPSFDIFLGKPDKEAIWCETVEGLSRARDRMEQIAKKRLGKYFVFCRRDHSILAQIDTTANTPVASFLRNAV